MNLNSKYRKKLKSTTTHKTCLLYLEQLTDTKYGNPCRPKIQPPPTENKIFTPENNQLHHSHIYKNTGCIHKLCNN